MKVSENDYSQYLEKYKMFQTTNQLYHSNSQSQIVEKIRDVHLLSFKFKVNEHKDWRTVMGMGPQDDCE